MRDRAVAVNLGVLVVCVFAGFPARAGSRYFSHTTDLPPRVQSTNIALYRREIVRDDAGAAGFNHRHPLIGRMLSEPTYGQEMFARWEAAPWHFEHHHLGFWRVLDGDMLWHQRHDAVRIGPIDTVRGELAGLVPAIGTDTRPAGGDPGGGWENQGSGDPAVPEPSAGILMVLGLIGAILAGAGNRRRPARAGPRSHRADPGRESTGRD